jgi:hypothetical protein
MLSFPSKDNFFYRWSAMNGRSEPALLSFLPGTGTLTPTLGCSAVLTLVFAAAGSLMAWFYKNPLVQPVAAGISLTIFLTSASVMQLTQKNVPDSWCEMVSHWTTASVNPLRPKLMSRKLKVVAMVTTPKSMGASSRASTTVATI